MREQQKRDANQAAQGLSIAQTLQRPARQQNFLRKTTSEHPSRSTSKLRWTGTPTKLTRPSTKPLWKWELAVRCHSARQPWFLLRSSHNFHDCFRIHQYMRSNPVRFSYERGTHSSNKSKCGENLSRSSSQVVPNGGPSLSGIK